MTAWVAVLVVGVGSYLLRVVPLLVGGRLRLDPRTQLILRHAAMGGIAALVLTGVRDTLPGQGATALPAMLALAVAAVVAYRGHSLVVVLLAGGTIYGIGSLAFAALG